MTTPLRCRCWKPTERFHQSDCPLYRKPTVYRRLEGGRTASPTSLSDKKIPYRDYWS